ncbi:MAG TPA: hypothetical protein VF169_01520 [Albitalea sp.]|uniref:hypothetical protein n=1 Tax=Piscinibacter sp. TaxID=1903157 RepID=UPI002ED3E3BC
MPLIALVHLALAAFFGVHAVRTGRPYWWLFVLLSAPMLGSVVYFFAEYLPSVRHTRGGMKAARAINNILDPNRELREATLEFDRTPTAYNRARLAAALLAKGELDEAIAHYQVAASGPYARDASFLRGLAAAQVQAGRHADAIGTFERLFDAHPDQRTGAAALGHAEALAGAGRPEARQAFEAVLAADGSVEAQSKYGLFLLDRGDKPAARRVLEAALKDAQRGHHHSRELNSEWIAKASAALRMLDPPASAG